MMKFDSLTDDQLELIKDGLYSKIKEHRQSISEIDEKLCNEAFIERIFLYANKIKNSLVIAQAVCNELTKRSDF